jgi:hypothetical protein
MPYAYTSSSQNIAVSTGVACTGGNMYGSWPFDTGTGTNVTTVAQLGNWPFIYIQEGQLTQQGMTQIAMQYTYNDSQPTQKEIALRIAQQEEENERYKKALEQKLKAEARADELLLLFLNEEQKKQYKELGYFETEVNDTRYRLHRGRAGNVYKIDSKGKPVEQLCIHPKEWLPDSDNVLAQFLALTTDPVEFERTANHTRLS